MNQCLIRHVLLNAINVLGNKVASILTNAVVWSTFNNALKPPWSFFYSIINSKGILVYLETILFL